MAVHRNGTQGIGFIRYIRSFQQPVFSEAEVDAMLHAIQTGRRAPTLATHREHVQNLRRVVIPQPSGNARNTAIRTVKPGPKAGQQFWAARRFPERCRVFEMHVRTRNRGLSPIAFRAERTILETRSTVPLNCRGPARM